MITPNPDQTYCIHSERRFTVSEAARYLGVSESFLNKARLTGSGPVFLKLGSKVAYERADLDRYLASRRRSSTSQMAAA